MRPPRARAFVCAGTVACLALGGWLALGVPGARAGAPSEKAGDVHDLIFHGGAESILIRLHILIGERPLGAAWNEAVARLHDHLDRGDAGTVAREEELADFAQVLLGPLALRARPSSGPAQDTTFARIDTDHDGKIGPEERSAAARMLLRFDRDDDESVSGADLSGFQDPNSVAPGAPVAESNDEPPVLLLDRSASRIRTIRQVLNRLDIGGPGGARASDQRLSRSEIRLAAPVFRQFDANRDGALDGVELLQFLDQGDPAVEVIVRLGPRPAGCPAIELIHRTPGAGTPAESARGSAGAPRVRMRKGDETLLTIVLGHLRVDLRTEDTAWDAAQARKIADRLFYENDLDDSKAISLSEARGQEPFQRLFRVMDRDGDGRITAEELYAALDLFEDLWRGHAVLSVRDRGVSLFGNLDASGDGRLGSRELGEVSERLASFESSGDGRLTAAEIPRRFELSLSQEAPPPGFLGGVTRPDPTLGPLWFQKMDRNHDGDLSPREFLGPPAEFLRLDSDDDGLIDAREASAAG